MTTAIVLPDPLIKRLEQRAALQRRSVEALVIDYVEAALHDQATEDMPSLEAIVAQIKAMPPNPQNRIPAKGDLAAVLALMADGEPDQEVLDALVAAELELRAINQADDIAEGRA